MEPVVEPTESLDAAMLVPFAREACGRDDLHLEGYRAQVLSGGAELGSTIQRISGVGEAGGQPIPWSLILKTITCGPGNSSGPQASHYWKREPYYYQSGILADLPAGLRAPRCYAIVEHPDSFQLFLEDLQDARHARGSSQGWPLEDYRTAARCLGHFNGAYLAGKPLPNADCISYGWLRTFIEECAPNMELFSKSINHPMVRRSLGDVPTGLMLQAWDQRQEIMNALDQLPQVFCHQDAFLRNLFFEHSGGGEQLAAVDWSFAGPGALGTELAPLVSAGIGLGTKRFSEGEQIASQALEGYLEGLGEAGWQGNPDLVRFGFSVSCFWRYPIGSLIGEYLEWMVNEAYYPLLEQWNGTTVEQVADATADWMSWSLPYYEETLRLKKELHL